MQYPMGFCRPGHLGHLVHNTPTKAALGTHRLRRPPTSACDVVALERWWIRTVLASMSTEGR